MVKIKVRKYFSQNEILSNYGRFFELARYILKSADVEKLWYNVIMASVAKNVVSWEAEEYIVREKNAWWYAGLIAVGLVLAGVAILLKAWSFVALVVVSVVALIVYAMRPPRILHYSLSNKGLSEGDKLYGYEEFKAFGLLREGENFAIVLTPRKRFAPRVTVYFPEAKGEAIVDAFGARLPMEEVKLDLLDKLIKFLRI